MPGLQEFYSALRLRESSNNYQAENSAGFLGAYQMGEMALDDAGFYNSRDGSSANDWQGEWTELAQQYGISSKEDYLNNPEAQDYAVQKFHEKVWGYCKAWGLDSLVGQTVNGIDVTKSGLIAAYHLLGVEGVKQYFDPNFDPVTDTIPSDANGTSIEEYLNLFGGYDVESLGAADLDLSQLYRGVGDDILIGGAGDDDLSTPSPADPMQTARDYFSTASTIRLSSPIALDLNGDGLGTTALAGSTAFFDLDLDGFRENVEWLNPNDGFLARDLNANGRIDDNTELFGDTEGHANGWDKLAELDSNSDGVINADDAAWSELLVWRDLDGDGYTDEGELFTLDELNIASISLDADDSLISSFTFADGTTNEAADLYFEQDDIVPSQNLLKYKQSVPGCNKISNRN